MLPSRDLGGALPDAGRAHPVKRALGSGGGTIKGCERGLEADDRDGARPLLGDAREVAGSDPLEDFGSVRMRLRPAVRSEVSECLLATPICERDNTVVDNDQTPALCNVEGEKEFGGLQAADLDGQLRVEAVAQNRKGLDRLEMPRRRSCPSTDSSP